MKNKLILFEKNQSSAKENTLKLESKVNESKLKIEILENELSQNRAELIKKKQQLLENDDQINSLFDDISFIDNEIIFCL